VTQDRPVVVRCDAGTRYGVGHVMRCVALAEEIASRGHRVVFVAALDEVPWARGQVLDRGFAHLAPPSGDEVDFLRGLAPAYVVLDSYVLPASVPEGLRDAGIPVLALVDGDPAERPADLVLDQNIGAEDDAWDLPPGTVRLAGLSYALMRDDIRATRPAAVPDREADPVGVLAFFGGTDAYGAAPVVVAAAAATGLPWSMTVVAADADLAASCRQVPLADGQRLEVVPTLSTLADAVVAADVVLSAAGTSSWELLCLGAAAGLVCVADNQVVSYGRAVDAALVVGIGSLTALRTAGPVPGLGSLLADAGVRRGLRERGWARVDGRGRERVLDAWEACLGGPGGVRD
jgi:spore coat polysaccharide biosynthesis predicted glycosyltransferase SpsG